MKVTCPISLGELVDKLSILRIKQEKITDSEKRHHIDVEERHLTELLEELCLPDLAPLLDELVEVNKKLWKIEDDIREKERQKSFDQGFIELARAVYITNDQRFEVKNKINEKYGSELREMKSYEDYS